MKMSTAGRGIVPAGRRAGVLTALVLGLMVALAPPASAHSALQSTSPGDGAVLRSAPRAVALVFNEAVQARFVRVAVTGPGSRAVGTGAARVTGARIEQAVTATDAGAYVVAYRIVSADGHTIEGRFGFRLAAPATTPTPSPSAVATPAPTSPPPAAPTTTSAPAATAPAETGDGSSGLGFLVVLGPMLLGLLAVGVVLARRPRSAPPAPAPADDDGG